MFSFYRLMIEQLPESLFRMLSIYVFTCIRSTAGLQGSNIHRTDDMQHKHKEEARLAEMPVLGAFECRPEESENFQALK